MKAKTTLATMAAMFPDILELLDVETRVSKGQNPQFTYADEERLKKAQEKRERKAAKRRKDALL